MIKVVKLCKDFGDFRAVDQISFEVMPGEVLGFLGPNGAGKSTTMRMIAGFLPPTSGTTLVCGYDVVQEPLKASEQIGYLPESSPAYNEMLIREFLSFTGAVRGLSGKTLQMRVDHVLELTSLEDVQFQLIETLSKGYRQRTCLAQSLIADPLVLILDEPTDGLDPNQKHEVRVLIQRMSEKRSILISTHILEEVEAVCSRAIIIAQGKIVADGTPEELLSRSKTYHAITLVVNSANPENLFTQFHQIDGIKDVQLLETNSSGSIFRIFPDQDRRILARIDNFVRHHQLPLKQLYVEKGHLDEVFRQVTQNPL